VVRHARAEHSTPPSRSSKPASFNPPRRRQIFCRSSFRERGAPDSSHLLPTILAKHLVFVSFFANQERHVDGTERVANDTTSWLGWACVTAEQVAWSVKESRGQTTAIRRQMLPRRFDACCCCRGIRISTANACIRFADAMSAEVWTMDLDRVGLYTPS
jgi:hypothetical protein